MNKIKTPWRRFMLGLLSAGFIALLLSCGGGGGDGSSAGGLSAGLGVATGNAAVAGTGGDAAAGTGTGSDGAGSGGSTGGNGGSGGTGSAGGGTSTAGNSGTDGSGVGSGGTGVTADAAGIGAADGLGSIILNGLRYDTDSATFTIEDASELQIGMSARVAGKVDANFTSGVATQVQSAAELRGEASGIDTSAGSFVVMGTVVSIDSATVWGDADGLTDVRAGSIVQVWGLPSAPGALRATRIQVAPTLNAPLVTGTVQNLDTLHQTFTLGQLTIDYATTAFSGMNASALANGVIVRVRGTAAPAAGVLIATTVQGWYAIPVSDGIAVQLAGVITDFVSRGSFKVLGTPVDATNGQITGGPANSLGNGVKVEVDGFMSGGVLVVKKLRIRNVPGTGGPASFTLIGAIGAYHSAADFRVRGQPVDASGSGVLFENGTVSDLANGRRVTVVGDRVVDGVLIAQRVTFTP
ncbi:DUF5666 domain-containing protein [Variovorax sp. NFACC27]|uniref:DUF5666 domain-containing protein n=1 Tax=unclassified Variovorax TaxID=663243 RepID=UPI000894DC70|nr:hypothetical protein SAMN03159371_06547 [Variovorax sp. NFACC28]SEG97336.1 hypothetical protein SAMN03159365_06834 [Variovorax sp. NFACC29]SFD90033.1 hypothetical protein SAMN03159379_06687 [Variovorax sp. NFACC26]SFH06173.1 hypothetical protein SAMN03159447_06369 [Variovorax sp. NFACC27]